MNTCSQTAILILISLNCILSSKVTWLPNSSFNVPKNFGNGKLPCSKQTVIFPESVMNSIKIDSDVSVKQLILPRDGELTFGNEQNLQIEFGATDSSNCTDDSDVLYLEKKISNWTEPDVWSSERFNEATPDAERVPCFDDIVVFPKKSQFTLVLPEKPQKVRQIWLPETWIHHIDYTEQLDLYITWQAGEAKQFILPYENFLNLKISLDTNCMFASGCPCQDQTLEIDCSLKFCPKPLCIDPIQPIGHCCKICGGTIVFRIDQLFDMQSFKDLVDRIVANYGEQLAHHVGRLPSNKVQVVVVDKGEYVGTSPLVINSIKQQMLTRDLVSQISSSPLNKSGDGGKIFISMFFAVVSFMGSIYLYYYKLPEVRFPFNRPAMFTRFHQRTESVVSLTGRDSGIGVSGGSSRASFRNPLYDPKKETVLVEESVLEE